MVVLLKLWGLSDKIQVEQVYSWKSQYRCTGKKLFYYRSELSSETPIFIGGGNNLARKYSYSWANPITFRFTPFSLFQVYSSSLFKDSFFLSSFSWSDWLAPGLSRNLGKTWHQASTSYPVLIGSSEAFHLPCPQCMILPSVPAVEF